jgi:hypothetical protein
LLPFLRVTVTLQGRQRLATRAAFPRYADRAQHGRAAMGAWEEHTAPVASVGRVMAMAAADRSRSAA